MAALLSSGKNSCFLSLWVLQVLQILFAPPSRVVHCIQYTKSSIDNPEPATNLIVIMDYHKNVSSYSGPFVMMLYA